MKLPFVSREAFEAVQDQRDYERENAMILRREYTDLLVKYHALVTPPPPAALPAPAAPPVKTRESEIDKIIREQADGDIRLGKHLRAYNRALKAEGKSVDERAGLLVQWTTTEQA